MLNKFDALFTTQRSDDWLQGEIEQIAIMTGRDCLSGVMAFGYPYTISDCRPYGKFDAEHRGYDFYSASLAIDLAEIPSLITELERRGFYLVNMRDCSKDGDEYDYSASRTLVFTSQAAENRQCGVFRKDTGERVANEYA